MKPLVSILIPAYNAERSLRDAVKSALAQTWSRKEVIIVEDGSRDQTLSIARQFASSEVKVVTQQNQGAAAARNNALLLAQGDYIRRLQTRPLPWKYAWIQRLFGWRFGKKAWAPLPGIRESGRRVWDHTLYMFSQSKAAAATPRNLS